MSSAILFAAIVAIWIGALVPRWLRHDHAHASHLRLRRFSRRREVDQQDGDPNARAGFSLGGRARHTRFGDDGDPREAHAKAGGAGRDRGGLPPRYNSARQNYDAAYVPGARNETSGDMAHLYETDEALVPVRPYGWSADEYLRHERTSRRAPHDGRRPVDRQGQSARTRREPAQHAERPQRGGRSLGSQSGRGREHEEQRPGRRGPLPAEVPSTADSERRARLVRGRRRLLWMLITFTAAGTGLAYLRLAAWWIVLAPVALLGGYVLLLREAARADAEARERSAVRARRAAVADTQREAEAVAAAAAAAGRTTGASVAAEPIWDPAETEHRAEVIDISERLGDQLYDQYADAKLRAVGN